MSDEIESGTMPPEMLAEFLDQPLLARLATVSSGSGQPHVVPVWYLWDGESIWISSFRSTRKIRDLQKNPRCSIVIDTARSGQENQAVIFEGQAELVCEPADFLQDLTRRIYTRYLGPEGVLAPDPQSWIKDPENLLIRLKPGFMKSWYALRREES